MLDNWPIAENVIPQEVKQFLDGNIRSIEQLEILFLLADTAERQWTATEVYRRVLSSEHSVERTLERLCQQGLLSLVPGEPRKYQFDPGGEELRRIVAQLRDLHRSMPVRIVEAIYGERGSALDEFSNAFRLKKDKP